MGQSRPFHQKVVVCKIAGRWSNGGRRLRIQGLSRELSCCLQEVPRRSRVAKSLWRSFLDPELSCCLKDGTGAFSHRADAAAPDSALSRRDFLRGIASSSPDPAHATSVDCLCTPADTLDHW